jgi:hypothetical protein
MTGAIAMTPPDDVEVARAAEVKVLTAISHGKEAVWELAEALYHFDEASGFRRLGHESLEEWLAQPEVGITKSVYYNLVGSWRKMVVHRSIEPARLHQLDPSKVSIVAEAVGKSKVSVEDAFNDVETLGYRDLREKYKKPKKTAEKKDGKAKEPATSTLPTSDRKDEAEVLPPEVNPVNLAFLVKMAGKRWHRKPDAAQLEDWLVGEGVQLLPGLPWEQLAEAAASGAKNPRIPLEVVQALVAWKEAM